MFRLRMTKPRATAAVFGAAFGIRESSVYETPHELQIAPNQRLEKQFRFNADDPAATMKIDELMLATPGYTRVSYNAIGRENVIRVSSDSQAHLDAVEVVPRGSHGLEVRTKKHHSYSSGGHLLTEIFLAQPAEVNTIASAGSGVAVVEENVLVVNQPEAAVSIKHSSSGKLFVSSSADTLVRSLDVSLSGSGDVHLAVPNVTVIDKATLAVGASGNVRVFTNTLDAKSVNLAMAGSGDIQLATQTLSGRKSISSAVAGSGTVRVYSASIASPKIKLAIAGSGDIRIGAQDQLTAQLIKSGIAGSGDIVIAARTAQCEEHDIGIAGSGDVDAGDLVVKNAKVSIIGSGDSIVQVSDTLKYSKMGSGGVKHVGPPPASVTGSGWHKEVKQIYRYDSRSVLDKIASGWRAPTAIPAPVEAFSTIAVNSSSSSSYHYHVEIRSWSDLVERAQDFFGFRSASAHAAPTATVVDAVVVAKDSSSSDGRPSAVDLQATAAPMSPATTAATKQLEPKQVP